MHFLLKPALEYLRSALAAKQRTNKSIASQLKEILELRFSKTKLGASEYFYYRLYDDNLFDIHQKKRFVGWRNELNLDKVFNDNAWRVIANDKIVCYLVFKSLGIPTPEIKAIFHPNKRFVGNRHLLTDPAQATDFLRSPVNYPFFVKPVHGTFGRGTFGAEKFDHKNQSIQCSDGSVRVLDELVPRLSDNWAEGFIFQDLLSPHQHIAELSGPTLSSVRLVVLLTRHAPTILRAAWKIPVGLTMCDNFMHGTSGNLLGCIAPTSGKVTNVVGGVGLNLSNVDTHPDTGQCLVGTTLPDWHEVMDLCINGASAFPGLRLQHWDIALTNQGPKVLEINVEGSLDLHQLAGERGFLDDIIQASL